MKLSKGVMITSAVASLFATAAFADKAPGKKAHKSNAENVACLGINECKGKGACGGADHACAGKNACKGKGIVSLSKKDCLAKGGKVGAGAHKKK